MKCPHCNEDIKIQIATKLSFKKCKILTNMTSILTVQCEKCKHVFQVPVQSKSFLSIKKEEQ